MGQNQGESRSTYAIMWELFSSWFRIGMFTFGGGYAMLPLIEKEVIDKKKWIDKDGILTVYALAQSVPGIIAINTAIFLGNKLAGLKGAIASAAGVIAPSIFIIITIAIFFEQIQNSVHVLQAFSGIRAAVVGLMGAAALRIALAAFKDKVGVLIGLIVFVLSVFTDVHPIPLIVGSGLVGFIVYYLGNGGSKQ